MGCQCHLKGKSNEHNNCNCNVAFLPCNCPHVIGAAGFLRKSKTLKCNKHITYLAKSKNRESRRPKLCQKFKKNIEMIRPFKISTRLEQLSIRPVRHLISARDEYKHFISGYWFNRFNKHIHKSLYTMYSRLGNITLPKICEKQIKWTHEEWKSHKTWLDSRAKPKKVFQMPVKKNKYEDLKKLKPRLEKLAKPKTRFQRKKFSTENILFNNPITKINKKSLTYMASEHICELSTPIKRKTREKGVEKDDIEKVSPYALQHQATIRTIKLSEPKKESGEGEKENPFSVIPRALTATCSDRVKELAAPKEVKV